MCLVITLKVNCKKNFIDLKEKHQLLYNNTFHSEVVWLWENVCFRPNESFLPSGHQSRFSAISKKRYTHFKLKLYLSNFYCIYLHCLIRLNKSNCFESQMYTFPSTSTFDTHKNDCALPCCNDLKPSSLNDVLLQHNRYRFSLEFERRSLKLTPVRMPNVSNTQLARNPKGTVTIRYIRDNQLTSSGVTL